MKRSFIYVLISVLFIVSCKKEFDTPPVKSAADANKINITNIKAKYRPGVNYKFKSDSNLYCVITADESSGNLFREIYVKDVTGALHIKFIAGGGLYVGDSIRINLQGAVLNENNKHIQIDSVDSENKVVKIASGYNPSPLPVTIAQVLANTAATNSLQSRLVTLKSVEFVEADRNKPYADSDAKASLNRVLRSCDGQTMEVHTSGYSTIARKITPAGNGEITGVLIQYDSKMELVLRNGDEASMTGTPCTITSPTSTAGIYLSRDFNDADLTSGGWLNLAVNGSLIWTLSSTSVEAPASGNYVKASNFPSNLACDMWLISPVIKGLGSSTHPILSFVNAYGFGPAVPTPLELYVSTNYTSGLPASATWTALSIPVVSSGSFKFANSGNISLAAYRSANTRIAFRYATSGNSSTWELDNILVKEE